VRRITTIFNFGDDRAVKRLLALVAALFVGLLAACVEPRAESGPRSSPGAGLLSYVLRDIRGSAVSYRWIFWSRDFSREQVFIEAPAPPRLVFWASKERRVYYAIGPRVFIAAYPQSHPATSYVARLPSPNVMAMWLERTTGRLRVIVLEHIPDTSITRKADGTLIYRLADGAGVAASGLPTWGDSGVCTVLELGPAGQWTLVARRATKYGAADTPYLDVVNRFRHERGVSQHRLLMSYTCACRKRCGEDLPRSLVAELRGLVNFPLAGFRYSPPRGGQSGFVFRTVMDDAVHAAAPVFLVSPQGQALRRIKLDHRAQIGFVRNGRYLLLANEYSGDNPTVLDLKTGDVVFSVRARAAVWVPR
jgi:hypothetical protein